MAVAYIGRKSWRVKPVWKALLGLARACRFNVFSGDSFYTRTVAEAAVWVEGIFASHTHIHAWTMVLCVCWGWAKSRGGYTFLSAHSLTLTHTRPPMCCVRKWKVPEAAATDADVAEKNDVIENPFFTHFNADSCEMILLLQTDFAHWEVARGIFTTRCDLRPTTGCTYIYYAYIAMYSIAVFTRKGSLMGLAGHDSAGDIANADCFALVFPRAHLFS